MAHFKSMWSRCSTSVLKNASTFSTKTRIFREVKIPVPWGHIAGKWWEPFDTRPILTLHGWQDNCGSFNRLVPLLTEKIGILAIDLPGHGYSSRLPPGMNYSLINNCLLIKQLMDYFKWSKVSLMGHSMGSITNFIYTILFPDHVDFIICIDGVKPLFSEKVGPRLARGIQKLLKYDGLASSDEEPPSYSLDVMRDRWRAWLRNSIALEHCDQILERTIAPSKNNPNQYYFTRDPRLKARLDFNWPQKDLLEGSQRVVAPILIIKFSGSGYFEDPKYFQEMLPVLQQASRDAQYHYVDGPHHTHLNNPERIQSIINDFIAKHDVEDRSDKLIENILSKY